VIAEEKICLTEVDDIVCVELGRELYPGKIVAQADKIGKHLNQGPAEVRKK
jgi:hypothetical protein